MKKEILVFVCMLLLLLPSSAECPDYNTSSVTYYRTHNKVALGKVNILADYAGSYKVLLYHPDAPNRIFGSWNFNAGDDIFLSTKENGRITIGGDWGIQIVFGNGVKSCIYLVGNISDFAEGVFRVKTTRIYSN